MSEKNNIAYSPAGKFEETRFEKIHNVIFDDSKQASIEVANEIAGLIKKKARENKQCILGLATGSTPIKVYDELIRQYNEEGLSFENVISFNLDEYYPMNPENIQSYYHFMQEYLFKHVNILPENINIPDGS
jgi:glucosamine-6-phosphate deaminase